MDRAGAVQQIPPLGVLVLEALVQMHEWLLTLLEAGKRAVKRW